MTWYFRGCIHRFRWGPACMAAQMCAFLLFGGEGATYAAEQEATPALTCKQLDMKIKQPVCRDLMLPHMDNGHDRRSINNELINEPGSMQLAYKNNENYIVNNYEKHYEKQRQLFYRLVMNEQDGICRPLLAIYNNLLKREIALYNNREMHMPGEFSTDFEVTRSDYFLMAGFSLPPLARAYANGSNIWLYLVNIFNDEEQRVVALFNIYSGISVSSEFGVVKSGMSVNEIPEDGFSVFPVTGVSEYIDPSVNLSPINISKYDGFPGASRLLTKWPNFDKIWHEYYNGNKSIVVPGHFMGETIGVFTYNGKTIIIMNQYRVLPIHYKYNDRYMSTVVISELMRGGRDDICYLSLSGLTADR